mmetsp:Transcript_2214/g.3290  ORF Transcript_2214/g.3290 Transcript_2214/m.3290 type:complete len:394 (-) Transcript_2214:28-1209(-)
MKLHVGILFLLVSADSFVLRPVNLNRVHSNELFSSKPKSSNSSNQNKGFQQFGEINSSYCRLRQEEILQLIRDRNKARRSRNFQKADNILADLNRENVHLNDSKKLWRADGEIFDIKGYSDMEYSKDSSSRPISQREEEYVNQRLRERSKAKLRRDFDTADDILDELQFLKSILVDDTNLTWKVTETAMKTGGYAYGGKRLNNVPDEDILTIQELVKERSLAKKEKEYQRADEILSDLEIKHGVRVDDTKKAWFFLPRPEDERTQASETRYDRRNSDRSDERRNLRSDWSAVGNNVPEGISKPTESDVAVPEGISVSPTTPDVPVPEGISISPTMPEGISISNDDAVASSKFESAESLSNYTVPILKEKLKAAGLPVSGRKAELIERLTQNLQ